MTDQLIYGAIADDDTGASDLAGMLADQGLRTLLVIDLPAPHEFQSWTRGYNAVVMAEGTRNLSRDEARDRTRKAIRLLQIRQPLQFQIKYCSTFDSTSEGNIGPSIDAAMDELNEDFTIAVPALPVNGRTTYMGYHFVHQQLLSDSPMRHHPLTPMDNSHLIGLLGEQTTRKIGLIPFPVVEAGPEAIKNHFRLLRADGVRIAVVDCLNDQHVENICLASANLRLISGSSAFGIKMPHVWREQGRLPVARERFADDDAFAESSGGGSLIVSGSCSTATRAQNERFARRGGRVIKINPDVLLSPNDDRSPVKSDVRDALRANRSCLLTTTDQPSEVKRIQDWGLSRGLSTSSLGEAIALALATLVKEIIQEQKIKGLIIAGGETSGALCRTLGLGALRVGRNIESGVPLCYSLGKHRLPVVLKSGNFGGEDFYDKALKAVENFSQYFLGSDRSSEQ